MCGCILYARCLYKAKNNKQSTGGQYSDVIIRVNVLPYVTFRIGLHNYATSTFHIFVIIEDNLFKFSGNDLKIVSEYDQECHNHKLQTSPWYREEEPHNNHETPGRQTKKQSNQLSLPYRDYCKARIDTK